MDELHMVRQFFGEPSPPTHDIVVMAKARLWHTEPGRRRPRGPRLPRYVLARVGVPVVTGVAAGAIFAAFAFSAPSSSPMRPRAQAAVDVFRLPPGSLNMPAEGATRGREILLLAALHAAAGAEQAPGRYWVTPGVVGNFIRVGPAKDPYLVLEKVGTQYWAAQNPHDRAPFLTQALGVQLASRADRAAWRRDGSPTRWNTVGQTTSLVNPHSAGNVSSDPLSAVPGKLVSSAVDYGSQPFAVGAKFLSLAQLRSLPADPARLKARLMTSYLADQGSPDSFLLQVVPPVLEMPVTPAVRSALYKLLADLPAIRSLGMIRDIAGQRGDGVSYTASYSHCGGRISLQGDGPVEFSSCTVQQILILDPGTGLPLAAELRYVKLPEGVHWSAPDGLFSYELFGNSYWTNKQPPA